MLLPISRRAFLAQSAGWATALAAAERAVFAVEEAKAKKAGANDTLRIAIVGVRGRGMAHVGGFNGRSGCEIVTICDCDESVIGPAMKAVEGKQGKAPKFEKDIRKVMEDKSIDVVSIATPNHWHALASIWAMQAGKDVYVEKPVSHNVSEGARMVEAARKYNRICQTGTQIRSMGGIREAMKFLHDGKLGKLSVAYGTCYKPRGSIGQVKGEGQIPATLDYDLWTGPAEKLPLKRTRLHYDWHWVWNTGNGDLGNQGIHQMDVARWGLNKDALAPSCISFGGRFGYVDDGETANTQVALFDYGDTKLIFEVRGLKTSDFLSDRNGKEITDKNQQARVGNIFFGSEGYLVCGSYSAAVACRPDGEVIQVFKGSSSDNDHFGNFVKAVRSRKAEELNADIKEGHLSSALCHLANISYRLGTDKPFSEAMGDDKDLAASLGRMQAHLKANGVDLAQTPCRVGRKLTIDPKTETFPGDSQANTMLSRAYRKGFEVPEKV